MGHVGKSPTTSPRQPVQEENSLVHYCFHMKLTRWTEHLKTLPSTCHQGPPVLNSELRLGPLSHSHSQEREVAGRDRIQNFTNLYSYLDSFLYFCPHWSVNYSFEKFGIDKKKGGDREIEFLVKGLLKISVSQSGEWEGSYQRFSTYCKPRKPRLLKPHVSPVRNQGLQFKDKDSAN